MTRMQHSIYEMGFYMIKNFAYMLRIFICGVLVLQSAGCGTLLYPERKGQKGGRIDPGVAVLDGVGLLLFIIPGIIAYAIDFSTGTIYLPDTSAAAVDLKNMKQVKFDVKNSSRASIEKIIRRETGLNIKLDQHNVKIVKLKSIDDMMTQFANGSPLLHDRIALR